MASQAQNKRFGSRLALIYQLVVPNAIKATRGRLSTLSQLSKMDPTTLVDAHVPESINSDTPAPMPASTVISDDFSSAVSGDLQDAGVLQALEGLVASGKVAPGPLMESVLDEDISDSEKTPPLTSSR